MADEFVAIAAQIKAFLRDHTIRVLLVEDSDFDAALLEAQLAQVSRDNGVRYAVERVARPEEARRLIAERRHHIVVLDWHLGDGEHTGLELARQLHADGINFPFLILTGNEADYREAVGEDCMGWINKRTATEKDVDASILHAVKNWHSRGRFHAEALHV